MVGIWAGCILHSLRVSLSPNASGGASWPRSRRLFPVQGSITVDPVSEWFAPYTAMWNSCSPSRLLSGCVAADLTSALSKYRGFNILQLLRDPNRQCTASDCEYGNCWSELWGMRRHTCDMAPDGEFAKLISHAGPIVIKAFSGGRIGESDAATS